MQVFAKGSGVSYACRWVTSPADYPQACEEQSMTATTAIPKGASGKGMSKRALAVLVTLMVSAGLVMITIDLGRKAAVLKLEMLADERTKAARDHLVLAAMSRPERFIVLIAAPDPWGNAYVHRPNRGDFPSLLLICKGPDGVTDTQDDILAHRFLQTAAGD